MKTIFPIPLWLIVIFALVVSMLPLHGCTQDRWLTEKEDAEMRAFCEPQGGCMLVPAPAWERIKRALGLTDV